MKRTQNLLMFELWTSIIISVIIILLYETDILSSGTISPKSDSEFYCVSLMEAITICIIPFSLRMFKLKKISRRLKEGGAKALALWGTIRTLMLCTPMIANTYLYFLSMNVSFGYMAIIFFICLIFIYPGKDRCIAEIGGQA